MMESERSLANRGIGFEVSRQLGALGYMVFLGCRDSAHGRAAQETLRTYRQPGAMRAGFNLYRAPPQDECRQSVVSVGG